VEETLAHILWARGLGGVLTVKGNSLAQCIHHHTAVLAALHMLLKLGAQ
jgi:hypothetical protein